MSWLTKEEMQNFKSVGKFVNVSKDAIIIGKSNIELGDYVRIDAQCLILAARGFLKVGRYVHLAAGSKFLCSGGITIEDFAQVAFSCNILSASDDFSGDHLIGPCVEPEDTKVTKSPVMIMRNCVIGVGCTIMPGTTMNVGAALGAMSMTKLGQELRPNDIYFGIPARMIRSRSIRHLELAAGRNYNSEDPHRT